MVSQLKSVNDLFSLPIVIGMISMALVSLLPGFVLEKPSDQPVKVHRD